MGHEISHDFHPSQEVHEFQPETEEYHPSNHHMEHHEIGEQIHHPETEHIEHPHFHASEDHGHEMHHEAYDEEHVDYFAHPKYKYEYDVKDPHTGDYHSHWEERDGDAVKGEYSVFDSDGSLRIVEYSADKHNGFQAKVKRIEGKPVHTEHHEESHTEEHH